LTSDLIQRTIGAIRPVGSLELQQAIQQRLDNLTKPPGSLGRLEQLSLRYGLARGTADLNLRRKSMYVFCADHGIAAEGVSAYPADVTVQMVRNFVRGGAAINVLCRQFGIETAVVDMGINGAIEPGTLNCRIASGTRNWLHESAMTSGQAVQCIEAGIKLSTEAARTADVLGVGEMGIGNSTTAAALFSALSGIDPQLTVGLGTGVTAAVLLRKAEVVRQALRLHAPAASDPIGILAAVGGFDIGGICGFLLGAAAQRVPVVMDGFITGAAALLAQSLSPDLRDYLFFSHLSAESGHARMFEFLGGQPLLSLDLRLGEGTGAALGINLIETAVRLYTEMATFSEASVSRNLG
jgi:nicotinate-nucleotide--dimethylbenzimidazole phosphoribosyltransferase